MQHEIALIQKLVKYTNYLDLDHLLMIFHTNNFSAGIVWIYEKKELSFIIFIIIIYRYIDLLNYYNDKDDIDSIITLCKTYGYKCQIFNIFK